MDIYNMRTAMSTGKSVYELPLRVTFYARVSTGSDEQAHSLVNQISYYSDLINNNPNWTYVNGYVDEALSGTSVTKRESFLRMIDDAKLDRFDLIVTKEISRFSRNTLDSIKYTQELLRNGVGVLFQSDNINTMMPDAELRLTIMSSIAQDEVRKISERVRFGFRRAIDNGTVLGNSKIWGYTKQDGKLVIDEAEADIVRRIFALYTEHRLGIRSIATTLSNEGVLNRSGNPFSFSTIKNILINPKYKGYYCGAKTQKYDYRSNERKMFDEEDWVMYKDEETVPPIVSEETWERANEILNHRSAKMSSEDKAGYHNKYAYSGKIICGVHNVAFYRTVFRYKSGNKEAWQCREYASKGSAGCVLPVIYTSELDTIMRDVCDELVKNRSEIVHDMIKIYSSIVSIDDIQRNIAKSEVEINRILEKKDKLLDLSIKGVLSDAEFRRRNDGFNDEVRQIETRIAGYRDELQQNQKLTQNIESLRDILTRELTFEQGFDRSLIETLLDRVEVYPTDDPKIVDLKVHLKVIETAKNFQIIRGNKTSVRCAQSILQVSNRSIDFVREKHRTPYVRTYQLDIQLTV